MFDLRLGSYADVITESADLIFTSPPYNIGSQSPARTGTRCAKKGTYDAKSYRGIREYADTMSEADYQDSQVEFMKWAAAHLNDDGVLVYNHKPRRRNGALIHPMQWFARVPELVLVEEVIWDRGSTHNHCPQMMWQTTERLYVFRKAGGKYRLRNHKGLTQRSDVWRVPRAAVNGHNAPFPLELARAAIEAWCPEGGTVMDPYSGSGTTAVAAQYCNRDFVGSELLPEYYNLACARLKGDVHVAA